ncbi:hypothetical protein CsSME_00007886 [Camellia sinensis var. sinensis]
MRSCCRPPAGQGCALPAKDEAVSAICKALPATGVLHHHSAIEYKLEENRGSPKDMCASKGLILSHFVMCMCSMPSLHCFGDLESFYMPFQSYFHACWIALHASLMLWKLVWHCSMFWCLCMPLFLNDPFLRRPKTWTNKQNADAVNKWLCPQAAYVSLCKESNNVDTPFFTILKTWMSPFEHSVIIHVRVHFEFSEVSATRLASRSLNLAVSFLVMDQTLVFLLLRTGNGLLVIPTPHRPWLEATGLFFLLPAKYFGRSALFLVDRPFIWSIGHIFWPGVIFCLFQAFCMPAVPAGAHIPVLHTPYPRSLNLCSSFLRKLDPFVLASPRSLGPCFVL